MEISSIVTECFDRELNSASGYIHQKNIANETHASLFIRGFSVSFVFRTYQVGQIGKEETEKLVQYFCSRGAANWGL